MRGNAGNDRLVGGGGHNVFTGGGSDDDTMVGRARPRRAVRRARRRPHVRRRRWRPARRGARARRGVRRSRQRSRERQGRPARPSPLRPGVGPWSAGRAQTGSIGSLDARSRLASLRGIAALALRQPCSSAARAAEVGIGVQHCANRPSTPAARRPSAEPPSSSGHRSVAYPRRSRAATRAPRSGAPAASWTASHGPRPPCRCGACPPWALRGATASAGGRLAPPEPTPRAPWPHRRAVSARRLDTSAHLAQRLAAQDHLVAVLEEAAGEPSGARSAPRRSKTARSGCRASLARGPRSCRWPAGRRSHGGAVRR